METTFHWLRTAFDGIVAFLPNLIAGLVVLLVGYVLARILAGVTRSLAHRLGFDRFVARLGLADLGSAGERRKAPSHHLGSAVFFVVMVATIMQTARAWNLGFIADGLARFIAYLPHVLAAAVVLAVAIYIGNWVRDRLARPKRLASGAIEAVPGGTRVLPSAVRAGILAVGAFMALRELQIAPEIVNAAFMFTLGAVALAAALAFGLGGRDVAGRIAQSWYERRGTIIGRPGPSALEPPAAQPAE